MMWKDWILMLLGATVAYHMPALIFEHSKTLNSLFGWHYLWLFVEGKPYRRRMYLDQGQWRVRHKGHVLTVVTRGYTMDGNMAFGPTWRPITWGDNGTSEEGSPQLLALDLAMKIKREAEDREERHEFFKQGS